MAYQHRTAYPSHADNKKTTSEMTAHVANKVVVKNLHSVYAHGVEHSVNVPRTANNADHE